MKYSSKFAKKKGTIILSPFHSQHVAGCFRSLSVFHGQALYERLMDQQL